MLEMFSNPKSVAVIGASADPQKLGNAVLVNLIESSFEGGIYPINLKEEEILGLKAYPSVVDVPDPVDLVVIVVPSQFVADVLEESGKKGVKGAIIITAGFGEAGPEGKKREQELLDIADRYDMRLIGPNCLGIIDTYIPMNASFAAGTPEQGTIAFMSQSGALCTAILDYALAEHIGFSHFVSTGNKADVDEVALFTAWRDDENTDAIIAYIEGIKDGPSFIGEARKTAHEKPIIAVKSGRTASGSQAVASHTGSLAGSDQAYSAAFKQAGIIRADTVQDLFDLSTAFAYQPSLRGNRIAIVTNAGGPGVMATDALEQQGLQLAQFQSETEERLKETLPAAASTHNPVDVLGDAPAERYGAALRAVLQDEGVDGILIILTPQTSTEIVETARAVVTAGIDSEKPIMGCWMGKQETAAGIYDLSQNHVPNYPFPERAIAALGAMHRYNKWKEQPETEIETFEVDREAVSKLFEEVREDERQEIGDAEAQTILKAYGINTPRSTVAAKKDEAVAYCEEIGYPVVLKIASPDILHKSDAEGILVGVENETEVREGFDTLIQRAKDYDSQAEIWGIQIQEMITDAQEVIVGMNRDPQFGPLIMFGLGGIYVEVLEDVTFRVAPMSRGQAKQMIQEIRSYPLLTGVRGQAASDREAIVDTILRIAQLASDFSEIAELDINPLFVRKEGEGAVAVDMRLILD
ncbi:MAG: acetate--CoA ligase alpha subunit [Anaerolineales bacterium]